MAATNTSSNTNTTTQLGSYVGVVIFDFSKNDLMALKWAHEYIQKLPKEYNVCLIDIRQVKGQQSPCEKSGPIVTFDKIETAYKSEADADAIEEFQTLAENFFGKISLKIYEGESIQRTLQHAIDHIPGRLKTLIIGCAGAAAGSRTILPVELQLSAGCSVVVANTDGNAGANAKYTLSISSTPAPTTVAEAQKTTDGDRAEA
ncbi:hypothetical protein U9M48_034641 [Paspalum notatum var. saurae]|uniref:UspA domain-containing protein n=1 Tax=Paspalum notatum var. saurae TaxID=547442 RepID=A0AAQ3UB81_PASNO